MKGIDLSIERGEFFGLLGPNGAGKSTLLNILCGYLRADEGTVQIGGVSQEKDPLEARRKLGLVPQEIALYQSLNAVDNLHLFGALYGIEKTILKERIGRLLNTVGLWDRRTDAVKTYSGGMKRRLNLVASILHDPPLLLCDEPTAGVDPQSRNAIFDFLQQLHRSGTTIVYTTHYMEEAERLCTRIGIIDHGSLIACGSLNDLLRLAPQTPGVRISLPASAADEEILARFGAVTLENDHAVLSATSFDLKLSDLLVTLEQLKIPYHDLRFDRPTLESLFLHLTGTRLRE